MGAEERVLLVGAHVLRAERRHARQTRFHRLHLAAHVTHDGFRFHTGDAACPSVGLGSGTSLGLEGFDHHAEHRVLLQFRLARVVCPAMRAGVGACTVPRLLQTAVAEAVAAVQTHRLIEMTQADAAGQIVLQAHQSHRFAHFGHDRKGGRLRKKHRNVE